MTVGRVCSGPTAVGVVWCKVADRRIGVLGVKKVNNVPTSLALLYSSTEVCHVTPCSANKRRR